MDANDLQSLDRERGKGRYQISCFPRRWHREERNKALRNGAIAACAYFNKYVYGDALQSEDHFERVRALTAAL